MRHYQPFVGAERIAQNMHVRFEGLSNLYLAARREMGYDATGDPKRSHRSQKRRCSGVLMERGRAAGSEETMKYFLFSGSDYYPAGCAEDFSRVFSSI